MRRLFNIMKPEICPKNKPNSGKITTAESCSATRGSLTREETIILKLTDKSAKSGPTRKIASSQSRWLKIASAFPISPTSRNTRGINKTDWIKIDRRLYDSCLDANDYRPKKPWISLCLIYSMNIRSLFVTLKRGRGPHHKYRPLAFTEQGVTMLSSVLRSERALFNFLPLHPLPLSLHRFHFFFFLTYHHLPLTHHL